MQVQTVSQRLALLRQRMALHGLDACVVVTDDFHGSEYVGDHFKTREYLSGFTGSAGTLVVLPDQAALWTAVTILIERLADCAAPHAAGLLTGLILIPAVFYTYTGICGKSVDVVNVLIFQAAVLAAWLVSRGLQRRGSLSAPLWQVLGILVQLGAAAVFAVWTVDPPELPLFVDPTNGTRGV